MFVVDIDGHLINLALCHKVKIDENIHGDSADTEFHVVAEQVQFHQVEEHQLLIGTREECEMGLRVLGEKLGILT